MEDQEQNQPPPEATTEEATAPAPQEQNEDSGEVIGSAAIRPVFLGNLKIDCAAEDVEEIFNRPISPPDTPAGTFSPIPIDRVDLKRGFCFVFLKDAASQADKETIERFVTAMNGMKVENVSVALRAEFARGDGRIKRKEDDRRREIKPSETLFVVNFHEETTKREDLQMLFEPFGELVRIDMKRNYAFVQFRTIEEATKAKETTNGGKLDQNVLTVEYVARQRGDQDSRRRRGGPRDRDNRRGGPDRGFRGGPDRGFRGGDRDDFRGGRGEMRGRRDRSPGGYRGGSSPPRGYRGGSQDGGYRRRSRSRSRSPPRGYKSSRSPPRGRYDERDRGGRYDDRGRSPDRDMYRSGRDDRDVHRGGRDDRGYRP